ncbi:MAG: prenyltransferase [Flavobacterium sp.]|uniref:geranylgeranylglycerol-phosphate geranylgeranyltransferase n=1 Tax=unclassified Flavobacterium TaxID=196869 RepID=UPI000C5CC980|nr:MULTISPECIES: geranylgeranylglycerol-phosphate geranylgeranyltransferase [unclassified Flavobacterium]MBF02216.1 prenyltransferase [Flavobacterium sp.]MCO6163253.1 geranylgeranylglycerol-phosphate geranylgeranyltransferase [Flavobacterium sp. NRK F7]
MKYLKLIRYQNLLLLALMQVLFRYTYLKAATYTNLSPTGNFLSLSHLQFALLVLSTVCIAAAGYVINNILDQDNDEITKPQDRIVGKSVSENLAYNIYVGLNLIGVGIGFYLSNAVGKKGLFTVFIFIAALLYVYSTFLKKIVVVSNIVVAFILSFSILILGIFDLFPATYEGNLVQMKNAFGVLFDYAVFAFIINFIREIVKDIEDTDGDYAVGIQTIPILLGKSRTSKLVSILIIVPILLLLYYINTNLLDYSYILLYGLLFIVGPLLYCMIKLWSGKTKEEFKHISTVLKIVLLFGILSIAVITYFIQNGQG